MKDYCAGNITQYYVPCCRTAALWVLWVEAGAALVPYHRDAVVCLGKKTRKKNHIGVFITRMSSEVLTIDRRDIVTTKDSRRLYRRHHFHFSAKTALSASALIRMLVFCRSSFTDMYQTHFLPTET